MIRLYWKVMYYYHLWQWNKYYMLLTRSPDWPKDEPWPIEQNWKQMELVHSANVDRYEKKLEGV